MLRLEALTKRFVRPDGDTVTAVDRVDLDVGRGELLALVGTSGCGKSTTLRLINRLEQPDAGSVRVDGEDVAGLDVVRLRRRMGYVVQSGALFPHLTVGQNVALLGAPEGWSGERIARRVDEVLGLVRLEPSAYRERFPRELSGGQQQRVGLARALFLDPPILLMDEPFGALDPITRREVRSEFRATEAELEKTTVLVTHDLPEAFELADRVGLMSAGRLVQVGTLADLRDRPADPFVERFLEDYLDAR